MFRGRLARDPSGSFWYANEASPVPSTGITLVDTRNLREHELEVKKNPCFPAHGLKAVGMYALDPSVDPKRERASPGGSNVPSSQDWLRNRNRYRNRYRYAVYRGAPLQEQHFDTDIDIDPDGIFPVEVTVDKAAVEKQGSRPRTRTQPLGRPEA